jgi:type VI protein secretion system component Hcp
MMSHICNNNQKIQEYRLKCARPNKNSQKKYITMARQDVNQNLDSIIGEDHETHTNLKHLFNIMKHVA